MKRDLVPEAAPTTLPAVTADGGLVNPRTGEVVNVDSPDDAVIDLLQFIRDGRALLDTLDGEVSQWLRARADGHITQGDADACLQTVVVVVSSEVKRVKNAAIPRIAEAIMDCRVEVPRGSRKVQLK
jgi:hypothetical protein